MSPKIEDVNAATDLFNVIPTGENSNTLEQAKLNLQSHREDVKTRNEYKKFVADFHLSERATNSFFRTPQPACLRSPITELKRVDGSVMDDQIDDLSLLQLLLALTDDCTGLFSDLDDADKFLELVQEYAPADGPKLKVNKTYIVPFSHLAVRTKLPRLRERSNFKVRTP
ncbi:hypothetical protein PI124_g6405 [Phytophthora idaei]|nr:hypothetical protein PI124_g6405 [Phytophthora idaei]